MHYIVEVEFQLEQLKNFGDACFINLITNNDYFHPKLAHPSLLYIRPLHKNAKGFMIVIDHTEGFSLPMGRVKEVLSTYKQIYCLNSKFHSYFIDLPLVDINYMLLEDGEKPMENKGDSLLINQMYTKWTEYYHDINKVIPLSKLFEYWEEVYEKIEKYTDRKLDPFYIDYEKVYKRVEERGMSIDTQCFVQYFTPQNIAYSYNDGKIYTQYNLYNVTARPTNAFNGINFLALHKEDTSRRCFIPENSAFVEFDFDGYHLRLIANLIGYKFPEDVPIHTYLGRFYFDKEILEEGEYQESKKITFQNIYGGIRSEYREIPFYKELLRYLDDMWDTYQYSGRIKLPTGKYLKVEPDQSPLKLFNYVIQNLETDTNVKIFRKLEPLFENKKSFICLVVYDSFLIDFHLDDGKALLLDIVNLIAEEGLVVKAKYGKDYDSLKKLNYL